MCAFSQNYTSYFTGNSTDSQQSANGGICLMGGATEDDNALKWFLERANGGDVLVIRASGLTVIMIISTPIWESL